MGPFLHDVAAARMFVPASRGKETLEQHAGQDQAESYGHDDQERRGAICGDAARPLHLPRPEAPRSLPVPEADLS